ISHYHDDHFAPQDVLDYLHNNEAVLLFAPAQAVQALQNIAAEDDDVFQRITPVYLEAGDTPQQFERANLLIEVVRIPHSGWPERRLDVENLAWRVTLDDGPTVLHLGDADTRDVHYAHAPDYWRKRKPDLAFPPYWYFLSSSGRQVLEQRLQPTHAIGIHVPASVPTDAGERDEGLREVDLFTKPGETREIGHRHNDQ
ncbi:MAG: MBL fold metallo-hydrolase, partial [Gammaproteobacteria bacterium]|nr:MBL fold metallo-hydrolase [Gammaproteobacteria bacterium]